MCRFHKFFHDEIMVNLKQGKSKHSFPHTMEEKKMTGGKKKQYKALSQIKSPSDALLWHKGLGS